MCERGGGYYRKCQPVEFAGDKGDTSKVFNTETSEDIKWYGILRCVTSTAHTQSRLKYLPCNLCDIYIQEDKLNSHGGEREALRQALSQYPLSLHILFNTKNKKESIKLISYRYGNMYKEVVHGEEEEAENPTTA